MKFLRYPRIEIIVSSLWLVLVLTASRADTPAIITGVERQPLEASVARLVEALRGLGDPLPEAVEKKIVSLAGSTDDANVVQEIQKIIDPHCLAVVGINPESRVKVNAGPAEPKLIEKGWRTFLVKVVNEAGVTAPLRCMSPQAEPMLIASSSKAKPDIKISPAEANRRWMDIAIPGQEPLRPSLSGLKVEYRVIQLYSRDAGPREATLKFDVGQGTQDLGFRNELPMLFQSAASVAVPLHIRDEDGNPTACSLLIRDPMGRIYPNPSRRLAPDFFFHHQIYRFDGEDVRLPPGKYHVTANRGPEYLPIEIDAVVSNAEKVEPIVVNLRRWVHMADLGWFSGDHHVHAAGCAHYENPTEGVGPEDMMRHILGEDLNVGCVLSWGPCWYHQKQFFEGATSKFSRANYLMRYDVEVSGFPSSHAGHLCLLNLTEDDYPGTTTIEQWPTWTQPVLKWGKEQGGVVGYSHSGWGLALPDYLPDGRRGSLPLTWGGAGRADKGRAADKLPDYAMPPFDGIGANEYIVTVANDACDFISTVDTPAVWELNIWYHTLNCGYRARISGETDFPCIYGERVGLGRIYVQMPEGDALTYEPWVMGLRDGRSYVGDGLCHVSEFSVNGLELGKVSAGNTASQLALRHAETVKVRSKVAAMLPEKPSELAQQIRSRRLDEKPYWHLERSRIEDSRKVPVELIVNGEAVARQEIDADGDWKNLEWDIAVGKSSWIALRVFPSMHTNPIFVEVEGQPIRASKRSAEWCRKAVDVCWEMKKPQIRPSELKDAEEAYQKARQAYDEAISQSTDP